MIVGTEWLIEAGGCPPEPLRDEALLRRVFAQIISDLDLKGIGEIWHKFEGAGGVTAMVALTESHLTLHTYPEHGAATFNLYCCRTRPEWDWDANLTQMLQARKVTVIKIERGDLSSISAGGAI
jgi:S-adenosylmethionine decarboxylase